MFFWPNECDHLIIGYQHCKQHILYGRRDTVVYFLFKVFDFDRGSYTQEWTAHVAGMYI